MPKSDFFITFCGDNGTSRFKPYKIGMHKRPLHKENFVVVRKYSENHFQNEENLHVFLIFSGFICIESEC